MTVAAGIEVGVIGRSQPTQGFFPGKLASSTGEANGRSGARSDIAAAGSSASFPPAAASFRANLQTQLAFLASGKTSLITEEETLDGKAEDLEYAPKPAAANQRAATPALIADRVLPPRLQGTQSGSQLGSSATNIRSGTSVVQGAGLLSARTAAQTTLPATESAETGSSTKAKSKQSAGTPPANPVAKSQSSVIPGTANPLETASGIASGPPPAMGNPIAPFAQALDRRPSSTDSPKSSILGNVSTADGGPDQARSSPANSVDRATGAGRIEPTGPRAGLRNETTAVHAPESQSSTGTGEPPQPGADSSISRLNAQTDGSAPVTAPSQDAGLDAGPASGQAQRTSQQASLEILEPTQAAPVLFATQASEPAMALGQGEVLPPNPLLSSASGKTTPEPAGGSPVAAIRQTSQRPGTAGDRSIPVAGQFAALSGEAASMVRDPSGVREPASPSAGVAGAEPALRETFAALDADVAPGATMWTHASPRQAEAGFQDPALGWIGVRAESNGVGVHASLVPGSDAAAQELGTHLEGLNAYMAEHHTPLESLVMAAPEGRGAGNGGEPGTNQGSNQGSNQRSNQGEGQNPQQQGNSEPESISTGLMPGRMPGMDRSVSAAVAVGPGASVPVQINAGAHISVMA
jgi:hypothetical protein